MPLDRSTGINNNSSIEVATPLDSFADHVPHGDSFAFGDFLTAAGHLELLKTRGLSFKNYYEEERFLKLLGTLGYYRLSQYLRHFYTSPSHKTFVNGTDSRRILATYRQNELLRSLLIDSLLKIESRLRTLLTEALIQNFKDPYWCYDSAFAKLELIENATRIRVDKNTGKTIYTEQSTRLFFEQNPSHLRLPAWAVMQCQDFGTLCQFLRHKTVPKSVTKRMVKDFALPNRYNYNDLYRIFDSLRYLRNLCVHLEKLLGESFRIAPPLWEGLHPHMAHRLPNLLFWIEHLLQSITTRPSFSNELGEIIKIVNRDCPSSMHIPVYRPQGIAGDTDLE